MKIKLELKKKEISQIEYAICMVIACIKNSLIYEDPKCIKELENLLNKIRGQKWIQIEKAIKSEDN